MLFKKKNIKKNIKLLSSFNDGKIRKVERNYYQLLEKSIEFFVSDSFNNNIIFFAVEMDMYLYKGKIDEDEALSSCSYKVKCFLEETELLEFAYLTKKNNKCYLLVGFKGLLGYSDSLFNNFYRIMSSSLYNSNVDLVYLKSKKKVLKYFNFLVEDFNFKESYCFKGNFLNQNLGGTIFNSIFSNDKEKSFFENLYGCEFNSRNLYLELKELHWLSKHRSYKYLYNYNKLYNKDYIMYDAENPKESFLDMVYKDSILFYKNDKQIISRRIEDEQSIINLWLIYMKANNLYINSFKIYEKKDSGELCYVGNLDFLKYNIKEIIKYVQFYFSFQLLNYPIENLILKYLGLAYEKILVNPYYYLPYLEDKLLSELIDKYINLYDNVNDLEMDELHNISILESDKEDERIYEKRIKEGFLW